MIVSHVLGILFIVLGPLLGTLRVLRVRNGNRHARCLTRIAALERELGIGQIKWEIRGEPLDYELGPGVVWRIDDDASVNFVQIQKPYQIELDAEYRKLVDA